MVIKSSLTLFFIFENSTFLLLHNALVEIPLGSVKFGVSVFNGSGQFELNEAGSTVATGKVSLMEKWRGLPENLSPTPLTGTSVYELQAEDIYKELRLRGYEYGGVFKGIIKSDLTGKINVARKTS